jgi:hypothetical protein
VPGGEIVWSRTKGRFVIALPDAQAAIDRCVECARACEVCSEVCVDAHDADCARTCRDCAEIGWACAGFLARGSVYCADLCEACAAICESCARECSRRDHDHFRRAADACRACAAACREMTRTTDRTPSGERL